MAIVSPASRDVAVDTRFFWERHRNEIVAALVVGILAMAGFAGYRFYTERRDTSAAESLATAKTPADFQKVIQDFPRTSASASAYLLLANAQRGEKKFAESNASLETFIARFPEHEMVTTARMGMAANLESLGKKEEALTTYRRLVADSPKDFNAPLALISQVHLLAEKNQIEEARRVCETVMTQYRDSLVVSEASRQLQRLGGGTEPKSSAPTFTTQPGLPPGAKSAALPSISVVPQAAPTSNTAPKAPTGPKAPQSNPTPGKP